MDEFFKDVTDNLMNKKDVSNLLEYFKVLEDFNLPVGYYSQGAYAAYGASSEYISVNGGDVIGLASMSYKDVDKIIKKTNICFHKSDRYPIPISKEFFKVNPVIFQNITKEFLRDKNINKILN